MVLQYGRNMASHCNVTHPSTTILSRLCHGVGNHETLTWTWSLRAQVRVFKLRPPPPPSTSSLPRCQGWRMVDGPRYPCTSKQAAWARASPIKAMETENPTPVSGAESLTRKAGASVKVTLAISGLKGSTCKVCGLLSSYSSDNNLTLYACDVSEQSILRTTVFFVPPAPPLWSYVSGLVACSLCKVSEQSVGPVACYLCCMDLEALVLLLVASCVCDVSEQSVSLSLGLPKLSRAFNALGNCWYTQVSETFYFFLYYSFSGASTVVINKRLFIYFIYYCGAEQ